MKSLFLTIKRHWFPLALINLLLLPSVIVYKLLTYQESWTAETRLLMPEATGLTANLGVLGSIESGEIGFTSQINPLRLQRSIIMSDVVMREAWTSDPEQDEFATVGQYRQLFEVELLEQSPVMSLTVIGSTPELAELRAAALLDTYQRRISQLRRDNGEYRQTQSQSQLQAAQADLLEAQEALANFRKTSGLVSAEQQIQELVSTNSILNTDYLRITTEIAAVEDEINLLTQRIGLSPSEAVQSLGLSQNEAYQQIRQDLTEATVELANAQSIYTDNHPIVQQLQNIQSGLEQELLAYVNAAGFDVPIDVSVTSGGEGKSALIERLLLLEGQALALRQQATDLQTAVLDLEEELQAIPAAEARLRELQRQYEFAEGAYKGLVAQVEQSRIDAFSAFPVIQILDPPSAYSQPNSSNLLLIVANGLIACTAASIGIILFLESRNPLLIADDLNGSDFPSITTISEKLGAQSKGLTESSSHEFQWLATMISSRYDSGSIFLVASAAAHEGRTYVTLGLAKALVSLGYRTLVVDADYRSSGIAALLKINPTSEAAIVPVPINSGLSILPFDASNYFMSDGAIAQEELKSHIQKLVADKSYDYVLIDSSPLSTTSKSLLLAASIRKVLFVVRPGLSRRNTVLEELNHLSYRDVEFVGLAVNSYRSGRKSKFLANRFQDSHHSSYVNEVSNLID